jgi:hypothetical protein
LTKPAGIMTASWADYAGEVSNLSLAHTDLTAGNIVAQTTLIGNLFTALSAVTLGEQQTQAITLSKIIVSSDLPTDVNAQRETKWLLRYHDAVTGEKFVVSVPCADLSLLAPVSQFADMSGTEFAALKTAWELIVRGPNDNNLTILDSAQHVGRNT